MTAPYGPLEGRWSAFRTSGGKGPPKGDPRPHGRFPRPGTH